jgi:hypothetical protein
MQRESNTINKDEQFGDSNIAPVRFRLAIFSCGDCLFLVFTGAAASLAMHLFHSLGWHWAVVLPLGMVAAMLIQIVLAKSVAPFLGSIESLIPSMVVAMFVPMLVCLLTLTGAGMSDWAAALWLGALGGTGVFLLIKLFEYRYKNALCRAFPRERA